MKALSSPSACVRQVCWLNSTFALHPYLPSLYPFSIYSQCELLSDSRWSDYRLLPWWVAGSLKSCHAVEVVMRLGSSFVVCALKDCWSWWFLCGRELSCCLRFDNCVKWKRMDVGVCCLGKDDSEDGRLLEWICCCRYCIFVLFVFWVVVMKYTIVAVVLVEYS